MKNSWRDVLSVWTKACEKASVSWYLYRETLLCMNAHLCLEALDGVQVAIFAFDLVKLKNTVLPELPNDWSFDVQDIGKGKAPLIVKMKDQVLLQIDVLWPVEDEKQLAVLKAQFKSVRRKSNKILRNMKILREVFGVNGKGLVGKALQKSNQKAFDEICNLSLHLQQKKALYYSDILTNKGYQMLDVHFFAETTTVSFEEGKYPVFNDYKQYLKQTYGDFEKGLVDSIGVGLTVEEKEELKAHQRHCKEALAFLQELAQKFHLRYYLLAGSVLGPVRDGGFIPWDDDIDVGIRVEELDHFEALIKEYLYESLPVGFELVQSGADNPYPRMFSKICFEGRCCIDLWPLVPTYWKGLRARWTWYFGKIITKAHYYKIGYKVSKFLKIVKPICFLLNDKQIMSLARHNERKYVKKKTDAYINLYSIYRREKETIRKEWLDNAATQNFDGLEVPVVGCTDQYLEHLYGDYMSKPAPWKRASRHVERFYSKK